MLLLSALAAAADGGRGARNAPFTLALTQHIQRKGLKLEDVVKRTATDVEESTGSRQTPWSEGIIRGDFYFSLPSNDSTLKGISGKVICPPNTTEALSPCQFCGTSLMEYC